MKILVISHTYIARINRDKWKVFAHKHPDANITVLVPHQWSGELFTHKAEDLSLDNSSNCSFISLNTVREGNEMIYGYHFFELLRLLKKVNPDIIHVEQGNNAYCYLQTILCTKLARLKSKLCFFTWINWKPRLSWKYKLFWRPVELFNSFFSHGSIAGNNEAKKLLREKYKNLPILVLPQLGVNTNIFTPARSSSPSKTIAFIGRLVEEKGVQDLLLAFSSLREQFPEWQLHIIGSGAYKKKLIDITIKHQLVQQVDFKDPVPHEEVAKLLQGIDILVLPSYDTPEWKEQFGHVLIEAMACKIPVVGSSGGEIPNVLHNGGVVYEQRNVTKLISCLQELMLNETLRKKVGENCYKKVMQEYTHEAIADKTYNFWQQLLT